jgi:hypothetical protein
MKLWRANILGKLIKIKCFLTGRYVRELNYANLITNQGIAQSASLLISEGTNAAFTYIAVGSGSTPAAVTDTALASEITGGGLTRASASKSKETDTITDDTAVLTTTFTLTQESTIRETGVFNASTGGIMLNRKVFSDINLPASTSVQFVHKFKVSPT